MNELLFEILCHLRAMQLFYHNSHNNVNGPLFPADHALLGDFYTALDSDYDGVAERIIGLFDKPLNLNDILQKVYEKVSTKDSSQFTENKEVFTTGLQCEVELQALCNHLDKSPDATAGTKQLIGDISDASEIRTYKIKQRLK